MSRGTVTPQSYAGCPSSEEASGSGSRDPSQARGGAATGGAGGSGAETRALGPRGRPGPRTPASRGRRRTWGRSQARGPPAPGREAPSPRPSRRAADARRCVRPRPAGTCRRGLAMEHIRTPKVGATRAGGGGRAGARGGMLSQLEARPPCPAQTELAPRASEGGGAGASAASPGGWASLAASQA